MTADSAVRHCDRCGNDVYLCTTDEATISHARAGHCIAREVPDNTELPHFVIGRPTELPKFTPAQEEAQRWNRRESGIDDAIRNAQDAPRTCPQCGYPAQAWRKTCRVCGYEMGRVIVSPGD